MHASYAQLARALDQIEAKVTVNAFGRAGELVRIVELALESYLESALRHPHVACEVSTEVLWRHFALLQAGVAARDVGTVLRAAADLRSDLLEHRRAHLPARPSAPA